MNFVCHFVRCVTEDKHETVEYRSHVATDEGNRSINQSIIHSFIHSFNQSINQSIDQFDIL